MKQSAHNGKSIGRLFAVQRRRERWARMIGSLAFLGFLLLQAAFFTASSGEKRVYGIFLCLDLLIFCAANVFRVWFGRCPVCGRALNRAWQNRLTWLLPVFPLPKVCPHCHMNLETGIKSNSDE